jgi:hypothetical protein
MTHIERRAVITPVNTFNRRSIVVLSFLRGEDQTNDNQKLFDSFSLLLRFFFFFFFFFFFDA